MAFNRCIIAATGLIAILVATVGSADYQVGASAPTVISGVIVPPASERSVMFTDRGKTYLVGMTTGRVVVIDGTAPAPGPVIPPYTPPAPSLTGLSKQVHDSIMASPIEPQNRILGAKALAGAIDSTVNEVGGLGTTDLQAIINTLASNAEAAQVNTLLRGWKLGDILAGANLTTKEQLLKALDDIKTGLGAVK